MPDITMCSAKNCKCSMTCYRYMACPSAYQSWADFGKTDSCEHYLRIKPCQRLRDFEIQVPK